MSISETLDRVLKKLHKLKIRKIGDYSIIVVNMYKNMKANFKINILFLDYYIRNVR